MNVNSPSAIVLAALVVLMIAGGIDLANRNEATSCAPGQFAVNESASGSFGCNTQTPEVVAFAKSSQICAFNSLTNVQMGFGNTTTFTPSLTGNILFTLTFEIHHPAGDYDANFTMDYGTGTAPTCGHAPTGTTLGDRIATTSQPARDNYVQVTVTYRLTGLAVGTTYWFDFEGYLEASVTHWAFNPQLTVTEFPS